MKIFWIVNTILPKLNEYLFNKTSNGVWMEALLKDFQGNNNYEIIIVTTMKTKNRIKFKDGNVTYYALPDNPPVLYNENKKSNAVIWRDLLNEEKPDIIQLWGTEFSHGLCALREAKNIPSVVYMQGCVNSIAYYYQAAIPYKELKKSITFRDIVKQDSILQQQKKYERAAIKEKEILKIALNAISENNWCNDYLHAIEPCINIHDCPLSINQNFAKYNWDLEKVEKYSIICTASGYPIKGLHILLRALAQVKLNFPDVKLYIPGTPMVAENNFKAQLRKSGYMKYIENLIKKLDLTHNIIWTNHLTQEKLAEQYQKSHIFVMCSAIENHSSSLKEAMMVGMPCISSYVGGIPEYIENGKNAFLYRFEEYPMLAKYIERIFNEPELAMNLSNQARISSLSLHNNNNVFDIMTNIYQKLKK